MSIPFYLVDAFTTESFKGNPAAVCVLDSWPVNETLLQMAQEHNQSETAFIIPKDTKDEFEIRWFTSQEEVDLCGHATLASSHIIFSEGLSQGTDIKLITREVGDLIIRKENDYLVMDLPLRNGNFVSLDREDIPQYMRALGVSEKPEDAFEIDRDIYFVFKDEEALRAIKPDFQLMAKCEKWVGITSLSEGEYDCVSRFFTPGDSHEEDPVTGSAHCTIAPYWINKLSKNEILAYQASDRGGELLCSLDGDRVYIKGQAKTYLKGFVL